MLFGRLFHNIGPFTEKALPPYVLRLYRGTTRSLLEEERKDLVGSYLVIMPDIQIGAMPRYALKTSTTILNSILTATGNQWSSLSIGVICSVFRVNDSKRAAEFCTN